MRDPRATIWMAFLSAAAALVASGPARGEVASDQPAAILIYPYISVDSAQGVDTVVQLSNTSTAPVSVQCVYEKTTPDCSNTTFFMNLTPQQPVAWRVSRGQATFPIDGVTHTGSDGSSNEGSAVPAAPSDPFTASLECIAVDRDKVPLGRNVLAGEATVEQRQTSGAPSFNAAAYNAVGIQAVEGAENTAGNLILGGPSAEYNGCPQTLTLAHFFDGTVEPTTKSRSITTNIVLVPCGQDLAGGHVPELEVTFYVFNEFSQRFSARRILLGCGQTALSLSHIDAADPTRSIFSYYVQGTLTGQTQVVAAPKAPSSQGGGVVAIAVEVHQDLIDPNRRRTAISTVHSRGTRAAPDFMRLPGLPLTAECVGDCDGDFAVTVDEILMGVSIALGEDAVSACPQLDPDGKGQVTVDEVLTAVDNALNGCPAH
jgi:hypothetical protein